MADKPAEEKAEKLLDTLGGVEAERLVDTWSDTLTAAEAKSLLAALVYV